MDLVLILGYSVGFATLVEWLASKEPERVDTLTGYAAWGALVAGGADVIENLAHAHHARKVSTRPPLRSWVAGALWDGSVPDQVDAFVRGGGLLGMANYQADGLEVPKVALPA